MRIEGVEGFAYTVCVIVRLLSVLKTVAILVLASFMAPMVEYVPLVTSVLNLVDVLVLFVSWFTMWKTVAAVMVVVICTGDHSMKGGR